MTVRRERLAGKDTERENAARQLREAMDRFEALVEATGQIVWTTPPDGLAVDMPLWRAYTGQPVKQVRGWGWLNAVHPEDRERVRGAWETAIAGRSLYEAEYRLRRHDGVYRYFLVRAVPVVGADGELREWVGVHTDITQRRGLEEALDALLMMAETLVLGPETPLAPEPHAGRANPAAQRLAALTRQVIGCRRLGISAVEPESELLRPIAVVGIPLEQEPEWWATEGQPRPLRDQVQPELLGRLEAGELVVIDRRQPPYNELPNPYGVTVIVTAPMRVGDRLVGILALDYAGAEHTYSEDELALIGAVARLGALVIERERMLREREESRASALALRETTRRFDEFLSIASHELRTPLTSIRANAQLAARRLAALDGALTAAGDGNGEASRVSSVAPVRTLLGRVERQTAVLGRLVDDLLDVSRIQANKLEFRFEPCDLRAMVREAVQEQRAAWPERPITLDLPQEPVRVTADADRIGQVVTNFLTNALKYSEEERLVAVRLESDGETARVSVQDEGPGLPPEEQPRVWERFHRAPGVRVLAGAGVGLGLGLHISKTIIERHGGRVGVQSALGMGSTFWFEIAEKISPQRTQRTQRDDES